MIKFLIISDDFTGALDTGVKFSKTGIPTMVSTNRDIDISKISEDVEVLSIDVESRHIDAKDAYFRVFQIAAKALDAGVKYMYKKTDSTLRGNIGSELTALMDAMGKSELMFVPAYPKEGRTTLKGFQYIRGELLEKTAFANDPLEPMKTGNIAEIIKKQSDAEVVVIEKGHSDLNRENNCKTIYVFDSQSDEDIEEIADLLKEKNKFECLAGCAGFAKLLPKFTDMKRVKSHIVKSKKNSLIICGSLNETSMKQVKYAEEMGFPSLTLTNKQLLSETEWESTRGISLIDYIAGVIIEKGHFIIKTADLEPNQNILDGNLSLKISEQIGKLTRKILEKVEIGTLVLFGGDTAVGIMNAVECYGINAGDEIAPGVVISEMISDKYNINIVTKAGGFGDENVILKIEKYLDENARI